MMSDDTEQRLIAIEEIGKGRTEGYVPVTPLGPPPQGEPLLAPQTPPPTQTQPPAQPQPQPAPPPVQQRTE